MDTLPGEAAGQPHQKPRYDRDLIHRESERLMAAYLKDDGRESGQRRIWTCPRCNKPKKLSLQYSSGSVGCLNAGCEVPTATDVIKLIGHLEGLETRGRDFIKICELCYELLGIELPGNATKPSETTNAAAQRSTNSQARSSAPQGWSTPQQRHKMPPAAPALIDEVFSLMLKNCPPEDRDFAFWGSRGIEEKTVVQGRFGSMSRDRCAYVISKLEAAFGRDRLLGVPGFRQDDRGRLGFTLWGDFTLIPYFDRAGRVRTIEGRAIGEPPAWGAKYTSPRGAGNHLYVFPSFTPDELVAFCEGPIGAILAAQHGIPVGSIQGVKRYRAAGANSPLPELVGVDFDGRVRAYVPDLDVKPQARKDVEEHLPRACDYLIARQNGRPTVIVLPDGKDLDEYLFGLSPEERKSAFDELLRAAVPPEDWLRGLHAQADSGPEETVESPTVDDSDNGDEGRDAGQQAPEPPKPLADEDNPTAVPADENSIAEEPKEASADDQPESPGTDRPAEAEAAGTTHHSADDHQQDGHEVYDRWYQGASSATMAAEQETMQSSIPYRPRQAEPVLPAATLATGHELQGAAVAGLIGTVICWFFITLWAGSDLALFGLLPPPPELIIAVGGLLGALLGGAVCTLVVFAILAARRRALRLHMRGDDVR